MKAASDKIEKLGSVDMTATSNGCSVSSSLQTGSGFIFLSNRLDKDPKFVTFVVTTHPMSPLLLRRVDSVLSVSILGVGLKVKNQLR